MQAVQQVLSNPLLKQGLMVAAPEIMLGIDLLTIIFARKRKPSVDKLLTVLDQRLAQVLRDLATTKSKLFQKECEIRAHEILGILNAWDKVS